MERTVLVLLVLALELAVAKDFSTSLPLGHQVNVTADTSRGGVWFYLCDSSSCSRMLVIGADGEGSLWCEAYTNCSADGRECPDDTRRRDNHPRGSKRFPPGQYVFQVRRLASEMAVSLLEHVEHKATVAYKEGSSVLKVGGYGVSNVSFSEPGQFFEPGYVHDFLFGDSGITLPLGHEVTVKVYRDGVARSGLVFYLCDSSTCSRISVDGTNPAGALWYEACANCNADGRDCPDTYHREEPDGSEPLPQGLHVFQVQRRDSEMAVWLQGHPEHNATVPYNKKGSSALKFRGVSNVLFSERGVIPKP